MNCGFRQALCVGQCLSERICLVLFGGALTYNERRFSIQEALLC